MMELPNSLVKTIKIYKSKSRVQSSEVPMSRSPNLMVFLRLVVTPLIAIIVLSGKTLAVCIN